MIWMGKGAKCLKLVFSKLKINLEENSKLETKGILSCHVRSWATCEGFLSWLVIAFKARLENEIPEGVQIHCCQWWNGRIYKEQCHVPASQWLLHGWIRSCCGHQRNQSKDCSKGSPLQTFPARTYGGSFQFFLRWQRQQSFECQQTASECIQKSRRLHLFLKLDAIISVNHRAANHSNWHYNALSHCTT